MIDDYAANYVWLYKAARDAYTASVPQALETWVDDYHYTVGERNGLCVPMVPRITDEDLDAIQQRYHPEPGYDPALSIIQKYQRSRVDVLIDLGTHAIYVPAAQRRGRREAVRARRRDASSVGLRSSTSQASPRSCGRPCACCAALVRRRRAA
jgi:hypothetical protein